MWYGQLVVGPPGSGKSTYCWGMQNLLRGIQRDCLVVNLDPMNDLLPYECDVNVMDLICGKDVMREHRLGPNGALIYCMEYLLENADWLIERLNRSKNTYVLFDCPGQVELFTHHTALSTLLQKLQRLDARLTAVHLVDSTLCTDGFKYISALLLALNAQLHLELPHVNLLSKIDLLQSHSDDLQFRIEYYADACDLGYLLASMDQSGMLVNKKLRDLTSTICELIEDFSLISFHLLDVQDKASMVAALQEVDKANGYALGGYAQDPGLVNLCLPSLSDRQDVMDSIQERYIDEDETE